MRKPIRVRNKWVVLEDHDELIVALMESLLLRIVCDACGAYDPQEEGWVGEMFTLCIRRRYRSLDGSQRPSLPQHHSRYIQLK